MPVVDPSQKKGWLRVLPNKVEIPSGWGLSKYDPTKKRSRPPPILIPDHSSPTPAYPSPIPAYPSPIPAYPSPIPAYPSPLPDYPSPIPDFEDEELDRERFPLPGEAAINNADHGQRLAGQRDPWLFSGGSNVHALNSCNFNDAIVRMEKAFVMFYNPCGMEDSVWARREFAEAADKPGPPNHKFASVDCSTNSELCCREQATNKLPIFKLYSNGYNVSTSQHSYDLNANQMVTLVRMAPVLNQPRNNIAMSKR